MEQGLQKVNHQSRLMEWGQRVTCASLARARAMATRCCWPSDSSSTFRFASSAVSPNCSRMGSGGSLDVKATFSIGGQIVDQVVTLEDERHMTAPVIGKAGLCNVFPLVQNLTTGGTVQAARQRQQRGLAAPGGAEDCVHLAPLHLSVDALQDFLFAVIGILHILDFHDIHKVMVPFGDDCLREHRTFSRGYLAPG